MNNPNASHGNRHGVFQPPVKMVKKKALRHRLVQFNGPKYLSYLVFDIDRPEAVLAWQDANLPRPTLIIENPFNGHAHFAYELATPVKLENEKSSRYAKAIRNAMRVALRADPDYRGNLTKNPFHQNWRVGSYDQAYTVAELTVHLDLDRRAKPKSKPHEPGGDLSRSRELTFAEWLRTWAYANVRFYQDYHSFEVALTAQAYELNEQFATNPKGKLHKQEFMPYVPSAARWTWDRYTEGRFRAGYQPKSKTRLLDLPVVTPLRERQQIGQEYTAMKRITKTEDKIEWAIKALKRDGCPVNKSSVAELAGLSRKTVIRHFDKVTQWVNEEYESEVRLVDQALEQLAREPALSDDDVTDSVGRDSEDSVVVGSSVNNLSESGFGYQIPSSTHNIDSSLTSSVDSQRHSDPITGSEMDTVTSTVTEVEKLSAFGTSLSLVGFASQGRGNYRTPNDTPPLDTILSYAEVQQRHNDGSTYGKVKGLVEAMTYAREMASRYGIVLVDAAASQRPTLERLAAEQAGMTLPAPEPIKRRTGRRFRPYAAAA